MKKLRFGVVGACGRGGNYQPAFEIIKRKAVVEAVCDLNKEALPETAARMGASEQYTNYEQMLERADIDAVLIGTPQHLHSEQARMALERGLHVLSEVPAGVDIEECRALVLAASRSSGIYGMAENYLYLPENMVVWSYAQKGLFGKIYYAEAEYLHELKELVEKTPWRRRWQVGIPGNTYPTHSLGPLLLWMGNDRVTEVCCVANGQHYLDPRGEPYENVNSVTLCKTRSGGLIKLRLDLVSERPHALTNYLIQGTEGAYESSRSPNEREKLWIKAQSRGRMEWRQFRDMEYYPDWWKRGSRKARNVGHEGSDYFSLSRFVDAVLSGKKPDVDIHFAMDMTLPGLVSQQSAAQGGRWLPVPDSRDWERNEPSHPQLQMIYPPEKFHSLSEPTLPREYHLRQMEESDLDDYLVLREKAGFGGWDRERVECAISHALPGGFFGVEYLPERKIVASAIANHSPHSRHPNAGVLDWVMADPDHAGRGLGRVVTAAVTRLLIQRGYQRIYLLTDDWRLPALAVYLQLGWEPFIAEPGMQARWDAVRKQLKR